MSEATSVDALQSAIANVPAGPWAVGVSGGADSVALLMLLLQHRKADTSLHVVHMDHQIRGESSDADARFVGELATKHKLQCTLARRGDIEPTLHNLPANPSERYRMARMALFKQVAETEKLSGVILAHHADDQAETVFDRLIRGSGPAGLTGMSPLATVGGLLIARPLIGVHRVVLREYLKSIGQNWREDESNALPTYLRNRLRRVLEDKESLTLALLALGVTCGDLRKWVRASAPDLPGEFEAVRLASLPKILARETARKWLTARRSPPEQLTPSVLERLPTMAADAATPSKQEFPGKVVVRRRSGKMWSGTALPRGEVD